MPKNFTLDEDLALATEAAIEAGKLTLEYFGKPLEITEKSKNNPVTEADFAADKLINEILKSSRPEYGWLSEESIDDGSRLIAKKTWVIDPIDGTRAFIKGLPHYAISIGLIENGKAILGAIYNPVTDELFTGALKKGAYKNGRKIKANDRQTIEGASLLGDIHMFNASGWPIPWPPISVTRKNSIAYRMALIASGEYDGAIATMPKNDWDIAAGTIIAHEAGAKATDHLNNEFNFAKKEPKQISVVVAGSTLHSQFIDRLSHIKPK